LVGRIKYQQHECSIIGHKQHASDTAMLTAAKQQPQASSTFLPIVKLPCISGHELDTYLLAHVSPSGSEKRYNANTDEGLAQKNGTYSFKECIPSF
jgi:hypothetical protein